MALNAPTAFAAAGVNIDNIARLQFDVGGVATFIRSSPAGSTDDTGAVTRFMEDRVVNFTVTEVTGATVSVVAGAALQLQTFDVTNLGNDTQDFLLAAIEQANGTADPYSASTDSFIPTTPQVFVDDGDNIFNAGDTALYINDLAAGSTIRVYIVSTIPAVADGSVAVMTLVAQVAESASGASEGTAASAIMADDNSHVSPVGDFSNGAQTTVAVAAATIADVVTTMQTVFNDPAGAAAVDEDSTGAAQDAVTNGQHSDTGSYTVGVAQLTVTKTASLIWDPVNDAVSPKSITGAYTQYTITVANDAAATVSGFLTSLSDVLPASLALDNDFVTNAGPGNATYGNGQSFEVTYINGTRTLPALGTCTAGGNGDGCDSGLAAGDTITIDYATLMPAEGAYVAGELKPNESVVIKFNAIIQ
ncbi:MAG: hypothetical protein KAS57_08605 [Gammaproteobacteria bacterium]|nr:hypothetical protein [Gammaproteobacteria bacterium]